MSCRSVFSQSIIEHHLRDYSFQNFTCHVLFNLFRIDSLSLWRAIKVSSSNGPSPANFRLLDLARPGRYTMLALCFWFGIWVLVVKYQSFCVCLGVNGLGPSQVYLDPTTCYQLAQGGLHIEPATCYRLAQRGVT